MKAMTNHHDHHDHDHNHHQKVAVSDKAGTVLYMAGTIHAKKKVIPCCRLDSTFHKGRGGRGVFYAVNISSGSDGANGGIPGAGIYEANEVIIMMR